MILNVEGSFSEIMDFLSIVNKGNPVAPAAKEAGLATGAPGEKLSKKAPKPVKAQGSEVTLDRLQKVDLSDCKSILKVIDKLQLETNVTGTRLAELIEVHVSDLSKARKGIAPHFMVNAFKQHLQFPKTQNDGEEQ